MKRLVSELKKRPLELLPERSVDCLHQFLDGYGRFGPPVWRDLSYFGRWLTNRLFYPQPEGALWWQVIKLNSRDRFDSYESFHRFYGQYVRQAPMDIDPAAKDHIIDPAGFDFYAHLYSISRRPGLYFGNADSVHLIAAYLAGYFKGKTDAGLKLTRDEKEFFRFEEWLRRHHRFPQRFPWDRLVDMWRYGSLNSFESFFAHYDLYLTDHARKAHGLEDIFEVVTKNKCTTVRRRLKSKLPKKLIQIPETKRRWRGYYPGWKPKS